jgi:SAM-dependent methyltransferase
MGFWETRASTKGYQSGYEDPHIEELEWNRLKTLVSQSLLKLSDLRNHLSCLEIGCHVGYTTRKLYELIRPSVYEAIDVAAEAIEKAQVMQRQYESSELRFSCASATRLDFKDQTFDWGFSVRCIQNIQDLDQQKQAFFEMHRILKSGGSFFLVENWMSDRDRLNQLRKVAGLEPLSPPSHCLFLDGSLRKDVIGGLFEVESEDYFASAYYFGTRFAKWLDAGASIEKPDDRYNLFFKGIEQEKYKLKLGPALIKLRKI